ncbi:MAG: hypothetical protein JRG76_00735 [Deltaproteobacteria bacterium]|nr:hypothetical protein [Deltaproteobacteria bacterium]MBW2413007.1 hypothetical protein [Deltaproteobacteria bacterium]
MIQSSDLRPGDVLLSRSPGEISDLVCALGESDYSHSALWDGDRVVAATPKGVRARELDRELDRRSHIDVYRFRFYDHLMGEPGWPAKPVIAAAHEMLGNEHAYHETFLAGLLVAIGRRPARSARSEALRLISHRIAEFTQNHITSHKRLPIVCAEVVASSFWRAASLPEHKYGLSVRIDGRSTFPGIPAPVSFAREPAEPPANDDEARIDTDYERLAQDCGRLLLAARPRVASGIRGLQHVHADAAQRPEAGGLVVIAGDSLLPLGCVTPGDLAASPSLEPVGRLSG